MIKPNKKQKMSLQKHVFLMSVLLASLSMPGSGAFAETRSMGLSQLSHSQPVAHTIANTIKTHGIHHASTTVATLRVYTKASDLKTDNIIRHELKSAFSADNPDSNPDVENEAAALNLNINETMIANLFRQEKFDLDQLDDMDKGNVLLGNLTRDNIVHLAKGNALFQPPKDITVITDIANIKIAGGSLVGVLRPNDDTVAVYDLEDPGANKVKVQFGKESLSLIPGKSVVVSKQPGDFEKITPARRIAYRSLASGKTESGLYVHTSDFSISSAILHMKPLQNILLSEEPEDKKIASRLLKNFVILQDVCTASEPYKMPVKHGGSPLRISSNSF